MDKSKLDFIETGIVQEIIDRHRPETENNTVYLVGVQDNQVFLATSNNEKGNVITYPMDWELACFVGYCLIVEASGLVEMEKISEYFKELSERRGELIEWFDENKRFFEILKERRR